MDDPQEKSYFPNSREGKNSDREVDNGPIYASRPHRLTYRGLEVQTIAYQGPIYASRPHRLTYRGLEVQTIADNNEDCGTIAANISHEVAEAMLLLDYNRGEV